MFDVIKKTLLAGVGAAIITKEKAEVAFDDFVRQGKVSAEDARVMAKKLAKQGRHEFEVVSREIEKKLKSLPKVSDSAARSRIAELEARLAALEKKGKKAAGARRRKTAATPPSSE